jgi:methylated-DNA-[protein]-cysteine S-methyltransferase
MVSCLVVETDLGFCALATRGRGLWRSCLPMTDPQRALDALRAVCKNFAPPETWRPESTSIGLLHEAASHLIAFLRGEPVDLTATPLDLYDLRPFTKAVLRECSRIPRGETLTYGELARRVGHPGAARAVGQIMARNVLPPFVPCHRVVGADGSLTGFGGGIALKIRLLEMEGIVLSKEERPRVLANHSAVLGGDS